VTGEHLWLNNGELVQSRQEEARLAFLECENFDPLYKIIGEIIGMPIEGMVIDITARALQSYLSRFIPRETVNLIRSVKPGDEELVRQCRKLMEGLNAVSVLMAKISGTGRYEVQDFSYENGENDFSRTWVYEPYSIPFVVGGLSGHIAAMLGGARRIKYHQIGQDLWEINSSGATKRNEELKKRLPLITFVHKDGDIELEACSTCGGPAVLANYKWHVDRGVILSNFTQRRMAILGPTVLDSVFEGLQYELGDIIPQTVVEAQRRFAKTGFYSLEEVRSESDIRREFALRGLGNLKEMKISSKGVRVRVDSAILHLMIVGLVQGLFEMAFDVESHVEWELSDEGNLTVEVTP
jgi:hypothetical protein